MFQQYRPNVGRAVQGIGNVLDGLVGTPGAVFCQGNAIGHVKAGHSLVAARDGAAGDGKGRTPRRMDMNRRAGFGPAAVNDGVQVDDFRFPGGHIALQQVAGQIHQHKIILADAVQVAAHQQESPAAGDQNAEVAVLSKAHNAGLFNSVNGFQRCIFFQIQVLQAHGLPP